MNAALAMATLLPLSVTAVGCNGVTNSDPFGSDTDMTTTNTSSTSSASTSDGGGPDTTTGTSVADSTTTDDSDEPKLDVSFNDIDPFDPPEPSCKVVDDMDAVGDCDEEAPPDSFDPEVQWTWEGGQSMTTPLVANLTDDNGDGAIDLCDTPDIVVSTGEIHILDGETGQEHLSMGPASSIVNPALGDIDGDGEPEIVTAFGLFGPLAFIAFDPDGTVLWQTEPVWEHDQGGAVGIADFDNDGSPEIYADGVLVSSSGEVLFVAPQQVGWGLAQRSTATIAADLDGDDDLELILGQAAYHHDGTEYYRDTTILPGYPQVANLDNDPEPEIIVNNNGGITILEHDGAIKNQDMTPTGDAGGPLGAWFRPSTVHDFDGDEVSEFAVSSAANYSVFEPNLVVNWSASVQDGSGWAAGTAFDFLGDGVAEAMYADETTLFIFGPDGSVELQVPRSSRTLIEYPVVADVDNDGSAEIVVVSSQDWDDNQTSPTVQVIRDVEDRWIQARRIWNQHTYHVTNVREDGTIPMVEPRSWALLNTYRTNAQIENGSVCQPPPEG